MNRQHWKLAITPLSPVHMGTDADYDPTNYVIDRGALYEFDAMTALSVLPQIERKKLDTILAGKADQRMLRQVQSFFYDNKDALIAASRHQVCVNESVEAFYRERIGSVSQQEGGGRQVQNKLEIQRCAWNPVSGQTIMPGTGLKGAIRTALLDSLNQGRSIAPELKRDRHANRKLQEQLLQGRFHTDPMRLIGVGDASLNTSDEFATLVLFALNRKKQAVTDKSGTLRQSKAEQQGLYQLLECLPAMMPRAFCGSLETQSEKQMPKGKWPGQQFELTAIASACNVFYGRRLDEELSLLQQRGYLDTVWCDQIQTLLKQPWLQQSMAEDRAFLVRVGRHSGAESVTLNGVRSIKIMKGRNENPDYLDRTKTVWLAGEQRQTQSHMQPFGWVLVEAIAEAGELPVWPEVIANHDIQKWREQLTQQLQRDLARIRALQLADQQAREEAQRQEAAQEQAELARKQAEAQAVEIRQAAFEALSESGKAIYRLREELDNFSTMQPPLAKDTYANLVGLINSCAEQASSWKGGDPSRLELAGLMEETYDRLGWYPAGTDKKKRVKQEQKKRDAIAKLRE